MRIGLSTSVIERGQSGIGQYVLRLVAALLEQAGGHQLVLFVLEQDRPLFGFAEAQAEVVVVPERFRPPLRDILWHQATLPGLAQQQRLDVLHVPSYRRMLWRRPCALVATIHDLAQFALDDKYDMARMFYGRVVARWLAARQHRILAVSRHTARDVASCFGLNGERVAVVPNGIDHQRFVLQPAGGPGAELRERLGLNGPYFLYVSRLEYPGKNHIRLIAAYERFRRQARIAWPLVLAGKDAAGAGVIHRAVAESPYRAAIHQLGFVEPALLPELYRQAGAVVYPSLYEGFGLPPLEAMACGAPVLSSPRGALAEVVGDAALYIAPESVCSMATQMSRVATQPSLRRRLRQLGLVRARQFDWRVTARQTLELYGQALAAAARGKIPCRRGVMTHCRS